MASLNKVFLIGNLTREPALRFTPSGSAVCEFGIAINRRFVSGGEEREETCFVDIVAWGKQAESCGRFLEKGSLVLVEGRLQYDQWEDRESGAKRSRIRIMAERVQFMSGKSDRQEGSSQSQYQSSGGYSNQNFPKKSSGGGYQQQARPRNQEANEEQFPAPPPPSMPEDPFQVGDEMEDDIPF